MRDLPTIIQDTREPAVEAGDHPDAVFHPFIFDRCPRDTPYDARPRLVLPTVRRKLDVGDYSLPGLETRVAIERKSGPDLLSTLFGKDEEPDALGEERRRLDAFRAEMARAEHYDHFEIVVEVSRGWLFAEAARRWKRYEDRVRRDLPAKMPFDPQQAIGILRGISSDLGIHTEWSGSKGAAEHDIGWTLMRIWEQATGGAAAKKAARRGYAIPWLGALDGVVDPAA